MERGRKKVSLTSSTLYEDAISHAQFSRERERKSPPSAAIRPPRKKGEEKKRDHQSHLRTTARSPSLLRRGGKKAKYYPLQITEPVQEVDEKKKEASLSPNHLRGRKFHRSRAEGGKRGKDAPLSEELGIKIMEKGFRIGEKKKAWKRGSRNDHADRATSISSRDRTKKKKRGGVWSCRPAKKNRSRKNSNHWEERELGQKTPTVWNCLEN